MNTLDLLLKIDKSKLKMPAVDIEITRLSEIVGEPVIFTCEALSADTLDSINENATRGIGENEKLDVTEMKIFTILEGVKNPDLKSKDLMAKYSAATPKELVNVLLLPGEIIDVAEKISDLSGFGKDTVREIKNA